MSSSSDTCHFSWLMKSCFPDPSLHYPPPPPATTISSLPDDLLLDLLSRLLQPSLPSLSHVCRRWSNLIHSAEFYNLRRRRSLLHSAVFVVSFSDAGSFAASYELGHWKTTSFLSNYSDDAVSHASCYSALSSHARLAAIGRWIFVVGKTAVLRCDAWTGRLTPRSRMSVSRKKFAVAVVAGKIYVAGGSTRTAAAVEEYDPEGDTWRVVSHAPRMRYGCVGAAVDGVFYVIGGLKVGAGDRTGGACVYASSMDLYDVAARRWLRSRSVPGGGCVVAACSSGDHVYILASHAVELSFWRFNGGRKTEDRHGGFGEWCRLKSPPLPAAIQLDGGLRFSCVGVGEKVVLIQIMGCVDDLLRRSGRRLVLVYDDSGGGEWRRGADLPDVIRRAAAVCVEW